MKKIIGYFTSEFEPSGSKLYLDEIVKFTNFAEVQGDFAIDITSVKLREDPRPYLNLIDDFAAFYCAARCGADEPLCGGHSVDWHINPGCSRDHVARGGKVIVMGGQQNV